MAKIPVISINKLISFIVFICMSLMASLFIYHANQKPARPSIDPHVGLLFPVEREIKPFELLTAHLAPFTQKNLYGHWTLLFFGFTHCASICPATLDLMKQVYPSLHQQYPNLQFVFVSLDPERDTPATLYHYLRPFHPDFIGVTGKIQDVRKLQAQLGIYSQDTSGPALSAATAHDAQNNYQILHTPSMMLISPHGKWTGLFHYGLKPDDLMGGIKQGIERSHQNP